MKWVRLKRYIELSGDTINGVKSRRKNGVWLDGKHSKLGPDGRIWVNVAEVEEWIKTYRAE